jgi:HEAT repeat protein
VLGDERAAKSLAMMLADDVAGVRAAALDAMAQLRGPAAVDAAADCARLLSDAVPHVRIAARWRAW